MKKRFLRKRLKRSTLITISQANRIIEEYQEQGFVLTLRQLYYQFVARGLLENKQQNYKNLGNTINDGRLTGLVDWYAIEDRTRNLVRWKTWNDPSDPVKQAAQDYIRNPWDEQSEVIQVWVEKDALGAVVERPCSKFRVPFFACKGYVSASEMFRAAERFKDDGRPVTILHLGDHDPSGIDMTRDIQTRFHTLEAFNVTVKRIALTIEQVREVNPPPNPVKLRDSRAPDYVREYGVESWELDALDPKYLANLIEEEVSRIYDEDSYNSVIERETKEREKLKFIAENWDNLKYQRRKK